MRRKVIRAKYPCDPVWHGTVVRLIREKRPTGQCRKQTDPGFDTSRKPRSRGRQAGRSQSAVPDRSVPERQHKFKCYIKKLKQPMTSERPVDERLTTESRRKKNNHTNTKKRRTTCPRHKYTWIMPGVAVLRSKKQRARWILWRPQRTTACRFCQSASLDKRLTKNSRTEQRCSCKKARVFFCKG